MCLYCVRYVHTHNRVRFDFFSLLFSLGFMPYTYLRTDIQCKCVCVPAKMHIVINNKTVVGEVIAKRMML